MFIVRRSSAYLKNRAKRRAVPMPKLHYIDTGLACHLLGCAAQSNCFAAPTTAVSWRA